MKLAPIAYLRPRTEEELLAALARHGSRAAILAGGQSLIPELALRQRAPQVLVDINRLEGAGGVRYVQGDDGPELRIGALTRHDDVQTDPALRTHAPMLALAAAHIGNAAVRNRGTVCGSLAQADPAAEFPLAAVALNARIVLRSARGARVVAADDFFTGANATVRQPDEYVAEVRIACAQPRDYGFFDEVARRPTAPAIVGVALSVRPRPGEAPDVRLAIGGVSDRPQLLERTSLALARDPRDAAALRALLHAELAPLAQHQHPGAAYRLHLAAVLLERARAGWCRHLDERLKT